MVINWLEPYRCKGVLGSKTIQPPSPYNMSANSFLSGYLRYTKGALPREAASISAVSRGGLLTVSPVFVEWFEACSEPWELCTGVAVSAVIRTLNWVTCTP